MIRNEWLARKVAWLIVGTLVLMAALIVTWSVFGPNTDDTRTDTPPMSVP